MMEKPDDLTLDQCQEAFAIFRQKPNDVTLEECPEAFALLRWKMNKGNFDLIMTLANKGLWHICEQIFGYLNYETLEYCRKVSKLWNESLERIALIKFIEEFADREVEPKNTKKSTIIPGWKKAAQKYGVKASIDDLEDIIDSLQELARENGKCVEYPVHVAAINGDVKLMEFFLRTSFDMNTKGDFGYTAFHEACFHGQTEIAQLIIQSSKEFCIDLNAKDDNGSTAWHSACNYGRTETAQLIIKNSKEFGIDLNDKDNTGKTALHWACEYGQKETVQMILKNWKEFGIDIKAQNEYGETALEFIYHRQSGKINQIKSMLEKEYFQIDVTQSVQSLNLN